MIPFLLEVGFALLKAVLFCLAIAALTWVIGYITEAIVYLANSHP